MSYSLLLPIFFLVNGLGTYQVLQHYVPAYKTLSYKTQQETLGRWNSFLMQVFLIGGYFVAKTDDQIDVLSNLFATYFVSDILHMLLYSYELIYYIHHCIPIAIFYFGPMVFTAEESRSIYVAGILLELTSPPISIVWFLGKVGWKPRGYLVLKAFAYLNFFGIRILYFPYYWYMYLALLPKIILAPFHVMNVYWFYSMTNYVVKSLKE
jgi:hypothetical protein